jgi:hypothetical protein
MKNVLLLQQRTGNLRLICFYVWSLVHLPNQDADREILLTPAHSGHQTV